ncbi:MAG: hypothetical protein EPN74_12220 [Rhodanobacter sp.]|nr:MAG: hypothetical protein EPN74_12220 [Rhodanobacter sp.]
MASPASACPALGFGYDAVDCINRITNGINGALTQSSGYDPLSRPASIGQGGGTTVLHYGTSRQFPPPGARVRCNNLGRHSVDQAYAPAV